MNGEKWRIVIVVVHAKRSKCVMSFALVNSDQGWHQYGENNEWIEKIFSFPSIEIAKCPKTTTKKKSTFGISFGLVHQYRHWHSEFIDLLTRKCWVFDQRYQIGHSLKQGNESEVPERLSSSIELGWTALWVRWDVQNWSDGHWHTGWNVRRRDQVKFVLLLHASRNTTTPECFPFAEWSYPLKDESQA